MAPVTLFERVGGRQPSRGEAFGLVSPAEVAARLADSDSRAPWKILEAHFSSFDHPLDGDRPNTFHIPGAIQIHPSYLEAGTDRSKYYPLYSCPADGNLLPDHELVAALHRLEISPDTPVVVYGTEPDGTMAAARLAWGLLYAGVKTVRLLDGGIDAWIASGRNTVDSIEKAWEIRSAADQVIEISKSWTTKPEYLAGTDEIRTVSKNPDTATSRLIDVRKPGEWDGTLTDYYDFYSEAGHIPNAHFQGDWSNLLDMASHKIAPKINSVARRWRDQGIFDTGVEEGRVTLIFYCGTGWRSSISFLIACLLGLRAKNYDHGFYGWSWDEKNEIAKGRISPLLHG